jgi:hypothetical protein
MSREALRNVLAEGRLVLRPDAANARFEGTLTREEFLEEKQIDIKLVAGAGFRLIVRSWFRFRTSSAARPAAPESRAIVATGIHSRRTTSGLIRANAAGGVGSVVANALRHFGVDRNRRSEISLLTRTSPSDYASPRRSTIPTQSTFARRSAETRARYSCGCDIAHR